VKELVEMVAKKLVNHPEDVQVRLIEGEDKQTYELRVNDEDMGRVIGKNGKTINAIRTLIGAAAANVVVLREAA